MVRYMWKAHVSEDKPDECDSRGAMRAAWAAIDVDRRRLGALMAIARARKNFVIG